MKLMRAVQYSGYGGGVDGLKLVEVSLPVPKADEILLRVEAAALNAFDWKIQEGYVRPFLPRRFPYIPGTDVTGEVVDVGSAVKKFKLGDKAVALLSHATGGALAEFAVVKENLTVTRPSELSPTEGAALPLAALTAHLALEHSAILDRASSSSDEGKKNILITAATSGVGVYALQLAKLGNNVHVTATCGARNLDLVKQLGADEVLDYKTPEGAALSSPNGKKYDCVIHCATGIPWATFEPNLAPNGKVIDLTPSAMTFWTFAVQKLTFSKKQFVPLILTSPKAENLEYLVDLVKDKKVKTVVDSTHSLSNAKDAWEKILSGHATGKIIVETGF